MSYEVASVPHRLQCSGHVYKVYGQTRPKILLLSQSCKARGCTRFSSMNAYCTMRNLVAAVSDCMAPMGEKTIMAMTTCKDTAIMERKAQSLS